MASCARPPSSTPKHQPKIARSPKWGCSQSLSAARTEQARITPLMTETMLKTVLALAGMPKICRALSMPITAAASETKRMNGKEQLRHAHGQLEFARHIFEAAADRDRRPAARK